MIKVKHLDGYLESVEREFGSPKEALQYDFNTYWSLGENCRFFYKNIELGTDNDKTIDDNIKILEGQIRHIDNTINTLKGN